MIDVYLGDYNWSALSLIKYTDSIQENHKDLIEHAIRNWKPFQIL